MSFKKMKTRRTAFALVCCLIFLIIFPASTFAAASPISVYIDGSKLATDVAPVMTNGRVLVPLRGIFEALGAQVQWDAATSTVTGSKDGNVITLKINSTKASINGETVILDVAAKMVSGRTMVPIRFISESLGADVQWDSAARIVYVNGAKNRDNLMSYSDYEKMLMDRGEGTFECGEYCLTFSDITIYEKPDNKLLLEFSFTSTYNHGLKDIQMFSYYPDEVVRNYAADGYILSEYYGKDVEVRLLYVDFYSFYPTAFEKNNIWPSPINYKVTEYGDWFVYYPFLKVDVEYNSDTYYYLWAY